MLYMVIAILLAVREGEGDTLGRHIFGRDLLVSSDKYLCVKMSVWTYIKVNKMVCEPCTSSSTHNRGV